VSAVVADLLVLWVVATAAGAALLSLVVGVQGTCERARRRLARRASRPRGHRAPQGHPAPR